MTWMTQQRPQDSQQTNGPTNGPADGQPDGQSNGRPGGRRRADRRADRRKTGRRNSRPSDGFPTPPKVGRPDGLARSANDAPDNVRDGVRAWYIVAGLQALTAILQLVMTLQDPRELTSQVRDQMDSVSVADGVSEEALVNGTAILNLVFMLAAVALCVYLTTRVARGGVKSRVFLMIGSVYLALMAVLQVFSSPPDNGSTALVLLVGAGTIISGVVALVGLWLVTRPDTADWFGLPDKEEVDAYAEKVAKRNEELDKERAEKKAEKERAKRARDGSRDGSRDRDKQDQTSHRSR